jgi:hypothetical protein
VPGDGGAWERLCNKMATGSGKTTVMAMIITWQVLNALTYPKRNKDFARAVFIVAPGLTVKERLRVLYPGQPDNYYDAFGLCPSDALRQKLNQAEILIENWHTLMPLKQADRSVVKKGAESDEAFTRRVLGKLAGFRDMVVINDEAHHAYRIPADIKVRKSDDFDPEEATRWIEGLDRIHKTRRIQRCFDLSATPFAPTGRANTEQGLFDWIVSDFGLNDAIAEIGETASADKDYEARLQAIVAAATIPEDRKQRLLGLKKEELLREIVDNVGKRHTAGQDLQNVVSVAMLSEGWDAKNVTHIMGLRAFTSQLLCEQVIGRGLRRVSYDTDDNGLFRPEYVNVFGVPLSIFQDVGDGGDPPPPPKFSTPIESLPERNPFEIRWPNVLRIDVVVRPVLAVDWSKVETLPLDPALTPISAEIAPALGGATDWNKIHVIDLESLPEEFRQQRLIFKAAQKAYDEMQQRYSGTREFLVFQLVRLVEKFLGSGKIEIPSLFHQEPLRKRILIALNIDRVVQHLLRFVVPQNEERIEPVFDEEFPIGSTAYMRTWYTTKVCHPTQRSQISHMIADSAWEQYAANLFESSDVIAAYAKNDHLGFQIYYLWNGARRRFVPDFLIRLTNGRTLVLEIKGEDSEQNRAKRSALDAWVRGVNAKGGFGVWCWDVAFQPAQIQDIVARASR